MRTARSSSSPASGLPAIDTPPRLGVVDWHAHWVAPSELRHLCGRLERPRITVDPEGWKLLWAAGDDSREHPRPVWPAATADWNRLRHMADAGIARQVLSSALVDDYGPSVSAAERRLMASAWNDDLSAVVGRHSHCLAGLAVLPTDDPEWAAQELDRAHRYLGLVGATLPGFAPIRESDWERLARVLEVAESWHSHIFFDFASDRFTHTKRWSSVYPVVSSAICSSALAARPNVSIQLALAPECLLGVTGEIHRGTLPAPDRERGLYFDVGHGQPDRRVLEEARHVFGVQRLLFGSDFGPERSALPALRAVTEVFAHEADRVLGQNLHLSTGDVAA